MSRFGPTILIIFVLIVSIESPVFSEVIGESFVFVKDNRPAVTLVVGSRAKVEDDLHLANILAGTIKQISGVEIPIAGKEDKVPSGRQVLIGTPKDIPLLGRLLAEDTVYKDKTRCETLPPELGEQGFVIHKTKHNNKEYLILTGRTNLAVLYAVNTLEDRLHTEASQVIVDGFGTRLMPIVNTPAFKYRSLQTAVGGPDFLGSGQYMREFGYDYKSFVDWLASHKINNILLHDFHWTWGLCYDSKRFPELVNRNHPNVKNDYIGDIIRYGRKRGVTVFPAQNMPDRCGCITKAYPELAGLEADGTRQSKTFCLNKRRVLEIWKGYWEEVLDRYPDVEAVGGQFGEGLKGRCQCDVCRSDGYFEKQLEFFDAMVKITRAKNPPVKCWIWDVPGARDIIAHRKDYPDMVYIDWKYKFRPFMLGQRRPKGDWYLYHEHGHNPEFGMKQMCIAMQKHGVEGLQIRAVQFKERDWLFHHFEEFAWNPRLSIEDYAHLYTTKMLRRKDDNVAKAYAHYIRAQGHYEIFATDRGRKALKEYSKEKRVELETYNEIAKREMEAFKNALGSIRFSHSFVDWLKARAEIAHIGHETRFNITNSDGSIRQIQMIKTYSGGYVGPEGKGYKWIGPKGEYYTRRPSEAQLRSAYGF